MSPRWLVGPVVVTMLTLAAGPVGATVDRPPPGSGAHPAAVGPLVDSEYLAGYDQSGIFRAAEIKKFVVPELDCKAEPSGVEIGLGYEPVEGAPLFTAGVIAVCQDGVAAYLLDASIQDTAEQSDEVAAGDRVFVLAVIDAGVLYLTVTNLSNPEGNLSVNAPNPGVEGVTYGALPFFGTGGELLPPPDFGKVALKRASAAPGSIELDRVGNPGIDAKKKKGHTVGSPTRETDSETIKLKYVIHCCAPFGPSVHAG